MAAGPVGPWPPLALSRCTRLGLLALLVGSLAFSPAEAEINGQSPRELSVDQLLVARPGGQS